MGNYVSHRNTDFDFIGKIRNLLNENNLPIDDLWPEFVSLEIACTEIFIKIFLIEVDLWILDTGPFCFPLSHCETESTKLSVSLQQHKVSLAEVEKIC